MSSPKPERPPQVTMAGWTAIVASLLVVATGVDTVAGLHTLERRRSIELFLSTPPGNGLGLDVSSASQILHVAALVAAGLGTAVAVLGLHVLRRHRGARVGLTVLAAPLFVAGLFGGAFFASLVAVAAVLMWVPPAKQWFDGPATAPPPGPPLPHPVPPAARPHVPPRLVAQAWQRPPRPGALVAACTLTWVFAGLALLVTALSLSVLTTDRQLLLDEVHRQNPDLAAQGLTDTSVVTATYVVGGVFLLWAALSLGLAGFAFAGRRWAHTALLASTAVAILPLVLGVAIGQLLLVLPLGGALATVVLLLRPEVRRWLAAPATPPWAGPPRSGPPHGGMGA